MPADVNSVNDEIKNEARKVWQNKKGLDRIKYFVYYYKVHFLVVVGAIIFVAYLINWYASMKDSVFSVVVVNGMHYDIYDYNSFMDDFAATLDYDRDEEEVKIDATFQIDVHANDQTNLTNTQKVFLYATSQDLDVIICDEDFRNLVRSQDCGLDLAKTLPADMQEKYADALVWYDFPIEEVGEDYYEEDYAGRNEATSIDVSEFKKIKETDMFAGKKAYAIIVANSLHVDNAIKFLKYLDE